MSESARVSSFDAVREFRAALCEFLDHADQSLIEVDAEFQRVIDRVGHDHLVYWKAEAQRRHDEVVQAKEDLRRVQFSITEEGRTGAEQKQAVKKAQARLEEAKGKVQTCQRWRRNLEAAGSEYRGRIQQFQAFLESDLARALTMLDRSLSALEGYAVERAPDGDQANDDQRAASTSVAPKPQLSSTVDPFAGWPNEVCRGLRRLAPEQAIREGLSVDAVTSFATDDDFKKGFRRAVILFRDSLPVPRWKPSPRDRVVVDPAFMQSERLFLERSSVAADGDSGWFVGPAYRQRPQIDQYRAVTIGELQRLRPDFRELLTLPVGFLAIIEDDELAVILDANDERLFDAAASEETRETIESREESS